MEAYQCRVGQDSKVIGDEVFTKLNSSDNPTLWIPAYAGMTVMVAGMTVKDAAITGGRHTGFKAVSTGWGNAM